MDAGSVPGTAGLDSRGADPGGATSLRALIARVGTPGNLQVAALVTALAVVFDQATKEVAVVSLAHREVVELPWILRLQLTFNEGAAFSLPVPWWVFPLVTALVLVLVARALPRAQGVSEPVAYGLLLGGALGNLTDRLIRPHPAGIGRGAVADFIATDGNLWPTFNVADVCITVGFLLLIVAAIRDDRQDAVEAAPGAAAPADGDG